MTDPQLGTGLPALDRVFRGLMPGDNAVWQVEAVDDYRPFVDAYARRGLASGRRVIYFRFAGHAPLLAEEAGIEICTPSLADGFERFVTDVHHTLKASGPASCFVFDVLSDLAEIWGSDRMLANFFLLTCPYVYDLQALAYFALLRGNHAFDVVATINQTTQIQVDVYRYRGELYIHPVKVQQRHSPTMYMLHAWREDAFLPVNDSSTTAQILTAQRHLGIETSQWQSGIWNRTYREAEETLEDLRRDETQQQATARARAVRSLLLRMAITRDERVLQLAERDFSLGDVLAIGRRMIGTGRIGGKAVGMLLARAILDRSNPQWHTLLEAHDSFFVGSDVFYTFLVENGCWWLRHKQRSPATMLDGVDEVRRRILMGAFPEGIQRQFAEMLDYFGQSPIIVRSSSLLEDNFGNAFSGKYESVFCANQGPPSKRLEDFLSAVRTIYASTMSEKALRYRAQRSLLDCDEQMALLVQRVSGARHGTLFFPEAAGVALSFNPYVWSRYIEPEAGMLRLVFGLGTRAVDRSDDDYTRIVALNAPQRRPESSLDEVCQHSQRRVDVIDLDANQVVSREFAEVVQLCSDLPPEMFTSQDVSAAYPASPLGTSARPVGPLTFEGLLADTCFVADMRQMLRTLQEAYEQPVDVEFTANFFGSPECKLNVLQCRPLQVTPLDSAKSLPSTIPHDDLILVAQGAVIGHARSEVIDRLVYVVPSTYANLSMRDRYAVARLIGRLLHLQDPGRQDGLMLVGPGRWGTTTPSLGVPVSFTEIDTVSALCEIVAMRNDLVPDVSLGTHFFNDLVEMDILYLAMFPGRKDNFLNCDLLENAPNCLPKLLPDANHLSHVVRVIDPVEGTSMRLHADAREQKVTFYLDRSQ